MDGGTSNKLNELLDSGDICLQLALIFYESEIHGDLMEMKEECAPTTANASRAAPNVNTAAQTAPAVMPTAAPAVAAA